MSSGEYDGPGTDRTDGTLTVERSWFGTTYETTDERGTPVLWGKRTPWGPRETFSFTDAVGNAVLDNDPSLRRPGQTVLAVLPLVSPPLALLGGERLVDGPRPSSRLRRAISHEP